MAFPRLCCPEFLKPHYARLASSPLGSRLARGTFWSLIGSVVSRGLGIISSILVARMLGKVGFGELGIIQSSIAMFGILAGLGMGITATKHIAEFRVANPLKVGRIVGLSSFVSIASGAIMTLVLAVISPWLASQTLNAPHLSDLLMYSSPLLLLGAWSGAQSGALAGFESFKRIAQISLVSGVISFPFMVGGAFFWGLPGVVFGLVGASLVGCLLNTFALRYEMRKFNIPVVYKECVEEWPVLWKFTIPSLLGGVLVGPVTWACGAMLVSIPGGYAEMGVFNAANQWFNVLFFLPGIIGSVVFPILCENIGRKDESQAIKILSFSIRANVLIVLPLLLLISFFSPLIMSWYGKGFSESWMVLVVAACTAGLVAVQSMVGHIIVAFGKMWLGLLMNLGWAAAFLGFTYILVGQGALGLSLARLFAYILHAFWTFGFAFFIIRNSRYAGPICELRNNDVSAL